MRTYLASALIVPRTFFPQLITTLKINVTLIVSGSRTVAMTNRPFLSLLVEVRLLIYGWLLDGYDIP
jgi:hypothetical protein